MTWELEKGAGSAPAENVRPVIVLKLGGSIISSDGHIDLIADEVARFVDDGYRVVSVVSAIAGTTDRLSLLGSRYSKSSAHLPYLLATGECTTAALLALSLESKKLCATVKLPHQIGLQARGPANDASLTDINKANLHLSLRDNDVTIVPGFFAENKKGDRVLLGRGGTDLTAVFLGAALKGARIRLIKDVDGVYEADPKAAKNVRRFEKVSYDDAYRCATPLIQPKTIAFAKDEGVSVEIAGLKKRYHTELCADTQFAQISSLRQAS